MERNGENDVFTKAEVEAIAEDAADRALAALFEKLDIDVANKDQIIRFRENLNFLDEQREGSIILKQHFKKGAVYLAGTALLGMVYLMWDVFKVGLAQLFIR